MRLKLLCGLSAIVLSLSFAARAQEKTAQEALREQYSKNREQIETIFKRKIEKISERTALPEKMRTAIYFVYFEGMSYADAAKAMRINVKKVNNLLYEAKKKLKTQLKDYAE